MMDTATLRQVYERMRDAPALSWDTPPLHAVSNASQGRRQGGLLARQWDIRKDLNDDQRLLSSIHFSVSVVARYSVDGGIYVPQLDPSLRALDEAVVPFFIEGGLPERRGFAGYHFDSSPGRLTSLFVRANPRVARELLGRIATNRTLGTPNPIEAEELVTALLAGGIEFPARPSENLASTDHRDTLLVAIADRLREVAGYAAAARVSSFHGSEYPPHCGCTIASAAMVAFGVTPPGDLGRKITSEGKVHRLGAVPNLEDLVRPRDVTLPGAPPNGYEREIFAALDRLNRTLA